METAYDLSRVPFGKGTVMRGYAHQQRWRNLIVGFVAHGREPTQFDRFRSAFLGINFALRGSGHYVDADGTRYEIRPGTLFHRMPERTHSTWFDPASDYAEGYISLDDYSAQRLAELNLLSGVPVLDVGVHQSVLDDLLDLHDKVRTSNTEYPTPLLFVQMLHFLHGLYERARRTRIQGYWERVVSEACDILSHNIEERLDMEKVAERLKVSYTSFRKNFRRIMGVAPAEYRGQFRRWRAKDLLATHSVKETASILGYGDAFTFSAQFKVLEGVSPRAYQLSIRSGAAREAP
ncbi:MAG: helix-turn-helix transcriptional regulator [Planctomycetota bacterium]|nr:helix-turn-helix transcriptional regulator [Planctomycetota bacterium]